MQLRDVSNPAGGTSSTVGAGPHGLQRRWNETCRISSEEIISPIPFLMSFSATSLLWAMSPGELRTLRDLCYCYIQCGKSHLTAFMGHWWMEAGGGSNEAHLCRSLDASSLWEHEGLQQSSGVQTERLHVWCDKEEIDRITGRREASSWWGSGLSSRKMVPG